MAINYFSPVRLTLALLPGDDRARPAATSSTSRRWASIMVSLRGRRLLGVEGRARAVHRVAVRRAGTAPGFTPDVFVPGSTAQRVLHADKPGNDPPFPTDPATVADAVDVAVALVASLSTDALTTYATARDGATAAAKHADPEGFIARMAGLLAPRR